ncbi:hypothetical protein BDM02DRAFT_3108794, partial [Thelephora ganbajun]
MAPIFCLPPDGIGFRHLRIVASSSPYTDLSKLAAWLSPLTFGLWGRQRLKVRAEDMPLIFESRMIAGMSYVQLALAPWCVVSGSRAPILPGT